MSKSIRPLAVGMVQQDPAASELEQSKARLSVAMYARREGYALVEIFDLGTQTMDDPAVVTALAGLLSRNEVEAVLTLGPVRLPAALARVRRHDVVPPVATPGGQSVAGGNCT